MSLDGVRVLVTGADGFIGSHLTEALVRAGADVRAFVLYNSLGRWGWLDYAPSDILAEVEIFPGDIRDSNRVRHSMAGVQTVFHLASLIAIPYSYRSPESYVDTNVRGTLNVLQASLDAEVGRFVHTSTSEVYGTAEYVPIDERHPIIGQSPYAATKIAADQMAEAFHRSYGLPVVTLRPFNAYGPRQSTRAIIPTIITQLLADSPAVHLGALEPVRDFTYVADTVQAFVMAAQAEDIAGEVMNIGSGAGISMGALAQKIIALMGSRATISTDVQRIRPAESEVQQLICSNQRAMQTLGWCPQVSLDEGLRRTIDWFSVPEHLALYKPQQYMI